MTSESQMISSSSSLSNNNSVAQRYSTVRQVTYSLCEPLEIEDYCVQSMPEASPAKWHLAHTTWFFETFVLKRCLRHYQPLHPQYAVLFNSYYNSIGQQHARPERGILSRPTVREVIQYRAHVDHEVLDLLHHGGKQESEMLALIELGIHHEQQHQELMLMDIKHAFYCSPLRPAYRELPRPAAVHVPPLRWISREAGLAWVGHNDVGFAFDNESPRHRTYVPSFAIADRLITCGEFLEFIQDGGYSRPELWLSEGWHSIQTHHWHAPLYWDRDGDHWTIMTFAGMRDLNLSEPVSHVSYFEADAFARWKHCWLPRESGWETFAAAQTISGNFLEQDQLQPLPPSVQSQSTTPVQMFGDLWEWTSSSYSAYPGYQAAAGALGEYNGKFMCNQLVLRGGSFATPQAHIRATYRNFFTAQARWPFAGIRLAKEM